MKRFLRMLFCAVGVAAMAAPAVAAATISPAPGDRSPLVTTVRIVVICVAAVAMLVRGFGKKK